MKLLLVLLAGVCGHLSAQPLPAFTQYPASETYSGKPVPPILRTTAQRRFRTMIRDAAATGPNFAGRYTLAQWGCGAGCVSMAVIDAKDGRVFDGPFHVLSWIMAKYDGDLPSNDDMFEALAFRKNSRLLIVRGCPEEDTKACASYFYEWTPAQTFHLLRRLPAH